MTDTLKPSPFDQWYNAYGGLFTQKEGLKDKLRVAFEAGQNTRAIPRVQPLVWQPIETAPKDGTRVLLSTPWGVCVGQWIDENPVSDCARAICFSGWMSLDGETQPGHNMGDDDDAKQQCPPTHWMPLPEPHEGE